MKQYTVKYVYVDGSTETHEDVKAFDVLHALDENQPNRGGAEIRSIEVTEVEPLADWAPGEVTEAYGR